MPGGKLEMGEAKAQGLVREMVEEIGQRPRKSLSEFLVVKDVRSRHGTLINCTFFLANDVDTENLCLSAEHAGGSFFWADKKACRVIKNTQCSDATAKCLQELINMPLVR